MTSSSQIADGTVAIIGCGAVGCFTAYRLAAMGVPVTLIDQEGPGSGATGNSAGNVQPASGDDDSYKIALGAESLALWRKHLPHINEVGGIDYQDQDVHYLYAAIDQTEELNIRRIWTDVIAAGLRAEWVDGDSARKLEPRLSESIIGGMLHHNCIQMDPKLLMIALSKTAEAEGATILKNTKAAGLSLIEDRITGVKLEDGNTLECSSVVIATGAWTLKALSDWLGYKLPVEPYGLQKVHMGLGSAPPLNCAIRWNGVNIVCRKDGLVHAGSRFDPNGFDAKPSSDSERWLLDQVAKIVPGFEPASVENLAAFAASTRRRIPIVGALPRTAGIYLAVPSTDGFLMAAVLADMTANLMVNGQKHGMMDLSAIALSKPL